jgi:hypothetical protein
MRQRFRPFRARVMARRPGEDGRFSLGPRERRLLGWIVALVLVIGIAVVVGVLGGNGDGAPVAPGQSASPSANTGLPITFGTAMDETTRGIPADARTNRFTIDDTFAYSIRPSGELPAAIYVEVERTGGGPQEIVQTATPENEQPVTAGRPAIAFSVAASVLFDEFGPGEYRMSVFSEPGDAPLAVGTFALVGAIDPSAAPSAAP